jgi:pimeloyl-ACP methyl ester carboxylesterase
VSITEQALQVTVDDLSLTGGLLPADRARAAVLLLHGIPSVAPPDPQDDGYPGLARRIAEENWTAAWLNMRAAKGQPGFFSIEGWVRDASAAVSSLKSGPCAELPLVLVGSSAGGAVAAEVTARGAPVGGLVLLAAPAEWGSFASHPEAGLERITQDAGMPVAPEAKSDPSVWGAEFKVVTTRRSITQVNVPTLIVHGEDDEVVPQEHARVISERAAHAELQLLPGGTHRLRRDERVVRILVEWLDRTFP